ncbi:hypothetical protein [Campylobacter pinnipediorum]|uniref:Lipoprotein n=1 Tax=Campylobacter pinnipediorum subsp. pinnipediorum TaxID=1660067 RepID=A0AAX0LCK0_9BACT|nr:hypothetical protein [Campylobacter pinnipediorum]OPA79634.1 hypothetical protein BFG05_00565 [Campylobacter pinnipediorum subsp. pinnipediorum]OPA81763.1 hypothetical protein BFG04_01075 [Campylobacter pinnipediorum subsp. pinnipediorum]
MLFNKTLPVAVVILILSACALFFATNESYQLSFKAKFYYELQNYDKSYELSKKSYELDKYNKMAQSLFKKNEDILKYKRYIAQADEYLKKIQDISKGKVGTANKERIRLICDIMIDELDSIVSSTSDTQFLEEATKKQEIFKKLKYELFEI